MDLEDLKYFVALAKELHFSRTADLLNIDQPYLSKHISSLEKELEFDLFDRRKKRSLQLTPAGKAFLCDVPEIIQQIERTKKRAYRTSCGEIGQLSIAINSSITNSILPNLLQRFRLHRPNVKLVLCELTPQEQTQQLLDYQIDVGFAFLPYEHHPDLESMTILSEALVVALPEFHPLVDFSQIPLLALKDEAFIFPSPKVVHFYQQIINFCEEVFGRKPRIAQEATWMLTVLSLVAGGVGISLLLENVQNIQRHSVIYRPIVGDNLKIQIAALWRRNDSSILLQEFRELILEISR
jgi:DNA-binding transcriptional LysR family regulator